MIEFAAARAAPDHSAHAEMRRSCFPLASLIVVCLLAASSHANPQAPRTQRVSVDSAGNPANNQSERPSISDNGLHVAFASHASNLTPGDTDGVLDVFVHGRLTGLTELVSVSSTGVKGNDISASDLRSLSADGRFIAFYSFATNLVSGDTNGVEDVFLRDRQTSQTYRVSVSSGGNQANDRSFFGSVSADGQLVAFRSDADNLVPGDTNGAGDVFVHDRMTSQTTRVSVASNGSQSNSLSTNCLISSDGSAIAFMSYSTDLVPGDTNNISDIFVHDLLTGQTERVSVDSSGGQANGNSSNDPSISADGRFISFRSDATNLVSIGIAAFINVYVHDRQTGQTRLVSVNSLGQPANQPSMLSSMSPEGGHVTFESTATNLLLNTPNGGWDCYVHDLQTGETTLVSVDSGGNPGNQISIRPSTATDARVVAFRSSASNVFPGPSDPFPHIYVHSQEGCPFPTTYCQPSRTSVPGCQMDMFFAHAPVASSPDDFVLSTTAPGGNIAICIVGDNGTATLPLGTLGGAICIQPPFFRLSPQVGAGSPLSCSGTYTYSLADIAAATPLVIPGVELFAQMWSRDPANPDGFALSDAVRFTVCP